MSKEQLICGSHTSLQSWRDFITISFSMSLQSLISPVCLHAGEQVVQVPYCKKTVCLSCIRHWLDTGYEVLCPTSRATLKASAILPAPAFISECLLEIHIRCDFHKNALQVCQFSPSLRDLKSHVEHCIFGKMDVPPTVSMSTTVADVPTASPRKLPGDAAERLAIHLVTYKARDGILDIRLRGAGASQTLERITRGCVRSDTASKRTVQRWSSNIQKKKELICGSVTASQAQEAADFASLIRAERENF